MKRAKGATSDFEKGVKDLARQFAPLLGGAGFLAITNKALESADAVAKAAKALGLSTRQFQEYSYAVKLGGIDSETFTTAIIKLNNQLAQGKLPYATTSEALLGISDRLKNAQSDLERTRIASEAFGTKLGARLIPALGEGADEILRLGREAEKLGIVFRDKTTRDAEKFKDQIEILGEVFTKNFQSALLEQFVGKSNEIRDIYTDPKFIESARALGEAFGALARAGLALAQVPAYLRAIFIELPSTAGKIIGLRAQGIDPAVGLNPNVSFQRPNSVTSVTHNPAAIDEALAARGLRTMKEIADEQAAIAAAAQAAAEERAKTMDDIIGKVSRETELLAIQNDHYGENQNLIDSLVQQKNIELDLAEKGITLSDRERANLRAKLDLLVGEKNLQDELKEAEEARVKAQEELQKRQEEEQKRLKDAIQDIKTDLARNLTDAIKGAQSLGDAFRNVASRIAEAVTQAQILKLLGGAGGSSGGGGFLDSIFGNGGILGGLLSSYDVGTAFVPSDRIAKVHQGEMIIPRVQAESIRKGGMGGTNVQMNIYTQDANSFARSQQQILAQTQQLIARASKRNN